MEARDPVPPSGQLPVARGEVVETGVYTVACRPGFARAAIVLALAALGAERGARAPDPAEQFARVRLIVTTKAATVAITVGGATIASYISSVLDGPPAVTPSRTGRTLQLSRNVPGQSAEARFDIILADAAPGTAIAWNLTVRLERRNADRSLCADRPEPRDARRSFRVDRDQRAIHELARSARIARPRPGASVPASPGARALLSVVHDRDLARSADGRPAAAPVLDRRAGRCEQ